MSLAVNFSAQPDAAHTLLHFQDYTKTNYRDFRTQFCTDLIVGIWSNGALMPVCTELQLG